MMQPRPPMQGMQPLPETGTVLNMHDTDARLTMFEPCIVSRLTKSLGFLILIKCWIIGAAALATFAIVASGPLQAADVVSMGELQRQTDVHGLAVDRQVPSPSSSWLIRRE
jgi:hypothetical protein